MFMNCPKTSKNLINYNSYKKPQKSITYKKHILRYVQISNWKNTRTKGLKEAPNSQGLKFLSNPKSSFFYKSQLEREK
jgi:hypothetical protein